MADDSYFDGFWAEQARQEAIRNDPVRREYEELKRNVLNAQNTLSSLRANLNDLHPTREELDALKADMSVIQQTLKSLGNTVWSMNMKADAVDSDKWWDKPGTYGSQKRTKFESTKSIVDKTCAEFAAKRVSGGA